MAADPGNVAPRTKTALRDRCRSPAAGGRADVGGRRFVFGRDGKTAALGRAYLASHVSGATAAGPDAIAAYNWGTPDIWTNGSAAGVRPEKISGGGWSDIAPA